MKKRKDYLERAEELLGCVEGNWEHSTDIQDKELVEWLIAEAKYDVKMNYVSFWLLVGMALIGLLSLIRLSM